MVQVWYTYGMNAKYEPPAKSVRWLLSGFGGVGGVWRGEGWWWRVVGGGEGGVEWGGRVWRGEEGWRGVRGCTKCPLVSATNTRLWPVGMICVWPPASHKHAVGDEEGVRTSAGRARVGSERRHAHLIS